MRRRHGLTRPEALVLVMAGGAMVTTATIMSPRLLEGGMHSDATAEPALNAPGSEVLATLEAIVRSSKATLSVQEDEHGRLLSLVLWISDARHPGRVNLDEVLVLRFSPILRSLRAATLTEDVSRSIAGAGSDPDLAATVARIDDFLRHHGVTHRLIAVDVTNVRIAPVTPDGEGSQAPPPGSPGWIELSWSRESDDNEFTARLRTALPPRPDPAERARQARPARG